MPTFAHPSGNGNTETVNQNRSFILIALFGALYLLYKRSWMAAFLSIFVGHPLVTVLTVFAAVQSPAAGIIVFLISVGIWAVLMAPMIERSYRQRGWREVASSNSSCVSPYVPIKRYCTQLRSA
jgi:hypothetical protein